AALIERPLSQRRFVTRRGARDLAGVVPSRGCVVADARVGSEPIGGFEQARGGGEATLVVGLKSLSKALLGELLRVRQARRALGRRVRGRVWSGVIGLVAESAAARGQQQQHEPSR